MWASIRRLTLVTATYAAFSALTFALARCLRYWLLLEPQSSPPPVQDSLSLRIGLSDGKTQTTKVLKSDNPQDIAQRVCKDLGIQNSTEISLCLVCPHGELKVLWLQCNHSLEKQGVNDGDTLLLRKKFFVLNRDVREAKSNGSLMSILYHQLKDQYLAGFGCGLPSCKEPARIAAYLHYLEQHELDLSEAMCLVPQLLKTRPGLLPDIKQIYEEENLAEENKDEIRVKAVNLLSKSVATGGYFSVTSSSGEPLLLILTASRIYLCKMEDGTVTVRGNWLVSRIKSFTGTPSLFHFNMVYGDGCEVLTDRALLIVEYLHGLLHLLTLARQPVVILEPPDTKSDKKLSEDAKQPSKDAKEPSEDTKQPSKDAKEPSKDTKQPSKDAKEPSKDTKQPSKDAKEPSEDTKQPSKDAKEPSEDTKQPSKDAKEPSKDAKEPSEDTKQPHDHLPNVNWVVYIQPDTDSDTESEEEPSEGERRPSEGESEPGEGEREPSEGEKEPGEGEGETGEGEGGPGEGERGPGEGEGEPGKGERNPKDEEENEEEKEEEASKPDPGVVKRAPKLAQLRTDSYATAMKTEMAKRVQFPPEIPESPVSPAPPRRPRLVRSNTFAGKEYQTLLESYRLFHIMITDQDMRAFMVNITQTPAILIEKLCTTFEIKIAPEDLCLCIPKGLEVVVKNSKRNEGTVSGTVSGALKPQLIGNLPVQHQFNFDVKPYILHLRRRSSVGVSQSEADSEDSEGEIDKAVGREWPSNELEGIARQREFYQSWIGLIQGDYPIEEETAIELASLLVHILIRCKEKLPTAQIPSSFRDDVRTFLPQMHSSRRGIVDKVIKAASSAEMCGLDETEAIEKFVTKCSSQLTYEGIFFKVKVPERRERILGVIPHRRMNHRLFGIDKEGIMEVDPKTGKVNFTHRYVDVYQWMVDSSGKSFQLDLQQWRGEGYQAETRQARQIIEVLKLYIDMTKRGQIHQAPAYPE